MKKMRVIIVDDNAKTRDLLEGFLPDYMQAVKVEFGDSATDAMRPDADGGIADIVVINGEDRKGLSLYLFDWIRNKSSNIEINLVPVIILIDDEFSDKALDFLEIGDAIFYEGELEEYQFFSIMNEAIESAEFREEPVEPSYSDAKNFDRIAGLSVKVKGENSDKKRSIVLDMDERLENLQAALERGKAKTQKIKALLDGASYLKELKANEGKDTRPNFLNKIRSEKGLEMVGRVNNYSSTDEDDIPEEFRLHHVKKENTSSEQEAAKAQIASLHDKIKANAFAAGAATGVYGQQTRSINQNLNGYGQRRIIIVVDDEEKNRRMCEVFLGQKYDVITFDNGRMAIDYFIKNTADLILMDTYMPNLGGAQTVNSIRWQPKGRHVPVIYMYDGMVPVPLESLQKESVVGIVPKPVNISGLVNNIDSFFRNMR